MIDAVLPSKHTEILLDHLLLNSTWEYFWIIYAGKKVYKYSYKRVCNEYKPSVDVL